MSDASLKPMSTPPPGGSAHVRERSDAGNPKASVSFVRTSVMAALG